MTEPAPGGITSIGLALTGGALRWSARRKGTTVVDTSELGLKLADGTELGTAGTVLTGFEHGRVDATWQPAYGRNARVSDQFTPVGSRTFDSQTSYVLPVGGRHGTTYV
ncbi:glycoside hydrolase family 97 N-terminal domain-containing protein [Actinacidiphila acididurans]|uniref:Glycoside hydrolase family 97 N-terminal domain-containing protein n=1 Tax=Actinacidiphila acididurans TaxID=2784346 RepID=A0ABS2THW7_9ACTN|nr:glycoside hydrolase family 97 N-terminal domain-containing protein [Actinacidiphila acididurans]MBM9502953.1 glycoside hydrolase family 97 N-terminal domain-containing protein [Actinacidiphila acididurans]